MEIVNWVLDLPTEAKYLLCGIIGIVIGRRSV